MSKIHNVVILGRMNVGKSTLFNRLAPKERSITLDYEGVTRDFIKDHIEWHHSSFDLIDSGGINLRKTQDPLFEQVRQQVLKVMESASVLILMVDGTAGLLPEDREIATYLHKLNKPVIIAINKIDTHQAQENIHEFYSLGFKDTISISAQHGLGINTLLDAIVAYLPQKPQSEEKKTAFSVVLLGKPNVGKSSLMNALLDQERAIVSDIPGTTREALSEQIMFYKEAIALTDTAGIRKKRAVSGQLEPLMVKSSFQALRNADIVVLLIDGSTHALADQELKLAFYSFTNHYKALILLINKQDLMTESSKKDLDYSFEYYKHLIKKIPVMNISCKTEKNIGRILPLIQKVWQRYSQTFDNIALTLLLKTSLVKKPLYHGGKLLCLYKAQQVKTAPITIVLIVNEPDWFGPSQLTFFENILRSEYDMVGVPVKFIVKKCLNN